MHEHDEFVPSVQQVTITRAILPAVAEAIKNRTDPDAPLTYALTLPEGYTVEQGSHGLLFIKRHGDVLRQQVKVVGSHGLPVLFHAPDRAKAYAYAIEHDRLELEANQEVPGWKF